ncbi:MAG: glutaminyl-peptide cyclotransferase, partial [Betaproteobacteria bacterium]
MQKNARFAFLAVVVVLILAISVAALHFIQPDTASDLPVTYTYQVVEIYPHDTLAFTQGLDYDDGFLYESTGGFDSSSLRRVSLETGEVLQEVWLTDNYFGEGLVVVEGTLVQLTWTDRVGFV